MDEYRDADVFWGDDVSTRGDFLKRTGSLAAGLAVGGALLQRADAFAALQQVRLSGTIKVGLLLGMTGAIANEGRSELRAIQTYIAQQGGRLSGMRAQLFLEDTRAEPALTIQKAQKLVEQDKVDVLMGIENSAAALAVRDYIHNAKKIAIITLSSANAITSSGKSPYIFRTGVSSWQNSYPLGGWARKVVGQTGIAIANDFTAGRELTTGFEQGFQKVGGRIVDKIFVPFVTADYSPYIAKMGSADVDFVWSTLIGTDSANFVKQYDQFGLKGRLPLIGVGSINSDDLLPAMGDSALGIRANFPYTPTLVNPSNQRYLRAFNKLHGEGPSSLSVFAYDAMQLLHRALVATRGNKSPEALGRAMERVVFQSPRGPMRFNRKTHGVVQQQYVLRTVKRGDELQNVVVAVLGTFSDFRVIKANY